MAGHTAQLQGTASLLPTQGENGARFLSGPDATEALRWSSGLLSLQQHPRPRPGHTLQCNQVTHPGPSRPERGLTQHKAHPTPPTSCQHPRR